MVSKEEIIEGRYFRTLSDSFGVPAGTLAQVGYVGTTWQGEFVFTVRWLGIRPGTQQRSRSDRSLNLWEQDLPEFEAVQQRESVTAAPTSYRQPELRLAGYRRLSRKRVSLNQLRLFTPEDSNDLSTQKACDQSQQSL
jgi:hypothetical protein